MLASQFRSQFPADAIAFALSGGTLGIAIGVAASQ